jgi:N-acetylneuraminic acid mutarotase
MYVIGGFTAEGGTGTFFPLTRRVHVYDAAAKSWKELASLPSQAAGNHSGVASDGQFIYVVAGQFTDTYGNGTNTAWRYDIAGNKWTQFVSLPAIRFGGNAFVANGFLHFLGGDKADRSTPTTDHWAIDLSDPESGWQSRADLPRAADHFSHAEVNGKFYVFGGEHGHHGLGPDASATYIQHSDVYMYDPATDNFTQKTSMPFGSSHLEGQTLVVGTKVVLIGGILDGGDSNVTSRVRVYDTVSDKWTTLSTRFPKRVDGGDAIYYNGKIYLTDGYSPDEKDRQVGFDGTVKFS